MLLSIEVSLYTPRLAVLDARDGKASVVFTSCNNRRMEARRMVRNRTPAGIILSEIENKVDFALRAYPIEHVVWTTRRLGIANLDASKMALGVILLTLHKAGFSNPEEMTGSRMRLYLTGNSKAVAATVKESIKSLLPEWNHTLSGFSVPIAASLAWYLAHSDRQNLLQQPF